jgi:hypothetical protein
MNDARLRISRCWSGSWKVIADLGSDASYELSLFSEMLAVYAGVTLFLMQKVEWIQVHPEILLVIIGCVTIATILIVIAANQEKFFWRMPIELAAIAWSYQSVTIIMWVSAHDLFPERMEVLALPAGVFVWVLAREITIFVLNALKKIGA